VITLWQNTKSYSRTEEKGIQRELERLGLPKIPFHNLRHSCASFQLAAGTSPKFVQELLGHTTVAFTLRTCSHLLPGVAEEMEVLEALEHEHLESHRISRGFESLRAHYNEPQGSLFFI
jgi:integrase